MANGAVDRRGRVAGAAQIAALASPVRQELVDTLESLGGEAAVADLAGQLGRPADGLYYHLRKLVRSGLLKELPDPGDGKGRRYRTAAPRGMRLKLRYRTNSSRVVEPVNRVAAGLLRMARSDFERALRSGAATVDGSHRDLWVSRSKGWVNVAELAEINGMLTRLGELLHRPRSAQRDRLVSLAWVLAPVPARPLRRDSARAAAPKERRRTRA